MVSAFLLAGTVVANDVLDFKMKHSSEKSKVQLIDDLVQLPEEHLHKLKASGQVDVNSKLIGDFIHVVNFTVGDDHQPFTLIPDTNINDLILFKEGCRGCFNTQNLFFTNSSAALSDEQYTLAIDYFFMVHFHSKTIYGKYYKDDVCALDSAEQEQCADGFALFGMEKAASSVLINGDGFLGLGAGDGF